MEGAAETANNSYYSLSQIGRHVCVCGILVFPPPTFPSSPLTQRTLCHCPFPLTSIPSDAWVYWVSHGTHRGLYHLGAPCSSQLYSPAGASLRNFICNPLTDEICSSSAQNPLTAAPHILLPFTPKSLTNETTWQRPIFNRLSQPCPATTNTHGSRTRTFSPTYILLGPSLCPGLLTQPYI